ncbi:NAD(P)/FAD-dependent oxidoreductase [Paenibacillus sp. GCM10023252]|uniref:NAD(P)/FAD-dependent oxidoreductase n=1 Tax=Paenibacillus sp. GCM10023252 TaxID=3252649 RepID=UPI00360F8D16
MRYDCVIIGGGLAGLSAALLLGRARRSVLLIDNGKPRNAVTHASHNYLTRDGITPSEFRRVAYEEVLGYPSVEYQSGTITDIQRLPGGFRIMNEDGEMVECRKLLISTGLKETLPPIPGITEMYGQSLFHCPYCDGWELKDQPLLVLAGHPRAYHMAKLIYQWSRDLVLCTNGQVILTEEEKQKLHARGVQVIEHKVAAFHGTDGKLKQVEWEDGSRIDRTGGFITPEWKPYINFQVSLGYELTELGGILTDSCGKSTVPGLYAAGEAATGSPSQLIIAAASGSQAAASINLELTEEEFAH